MTEEITQRIVHELAKKEAERQWAEAERRLAYSVEYAQAGLKALFMSNGGAIIALLTFVGNGANVTEPNAIWWSFVWFSSGLAAVIAAYVIAYLSQSSIMVEAFVEARNADAAAFETGQSYKIGKWERAGNTLSWSAVVVTLLSFVSFVIGAFVALDAIT